MLVTSEAVASQPQDLHNHTNGNSQEPSSLVGGRFWSLPLVDTGWMRTRRPEGLKIRTNSSSMSGLWTSVEGGMVPERMASKEDCGWLAVV